MNLRIKDGPKLVAFLHGIVSGSGARVLSTDGFEVVEIDSLVFYHGNDPLTVGGPFDCLEHLVCSEGVRRFAEPGRGPPDEPPRVEVVEWASSFFRIEREGDVRIERHGSLEDAKVGEDIDGSFSLIQEHTMATVPNEADLRVHTRRLRSFAEAREWEQFHTPKNLAMSVAIEAGELMEPLQWLTEEEVEALRADPEACDELGREIADVAIYLVRLADVMGIDIGGAIARKIEENDERFPVEVVRGKAGVEGAE